MAFPIAPSNGQLATVNGINYTYNSTTNSWSRNQSVLPIMSITVDTFTSDGITTTYTLSSTPVAKEFISVNIDGVLQQKSAYTLSSNIIGLTGTPITGAVIEVKTTTSAPTSVLTGLVFDTFTGDGVTTAFTLSSIPTNKNYTMVTIGGVTQQKSTYSISGTTLTFSTTPALTAPIEVTTFGPAISTSALAGGGDTQVQFNSSGVLSGSSNLTFNNTTNTLATGNIALANAVASGNITASYFVGNGSQLTGVSTAGTVTTGAQPNITSVGALTTLTVSGLATFQSTADVLSNKTGATGNVSHDLSSSGVFYHASPAANFTANFTNVSTTDSRVIMASLLVAQGATPYIPNGVQVDGAVQTIKWSGGTAPTGNASKLDIFTFSLLRNSNTWIIMGQGSTYG